MPGERYFFVACHLSVGVMPALRAVPDPKHNYGGRSLAYAVVVLLPFPVPQAVDGVATTATANILVLNVITEASYTVHCVLPTSARCGSRPWPPAERRNPST